jgi:hypothetical protein
VFLLARVSTVIYAFDHTKAHRVLFAQAAFVGKPNQPHVAFDGKRTHEGAYFGFTLLPFSNGNEFGNLPRPSAVGYKFLVQ